MPPATTATVDIAVAVVQLDGKFLIGRRPEGTVLAGLWEFPGGKVQPGESPCDAARRECLEESGLTVNVGRMYVEVLHDYEHSRVRLHFFACTPADMNQPINPRFQWAPRAELSRYQFPAANAKLLELLAAR